MFCVYRDVLVAILAMYFGGVSAMCWRCILVVHFGLDEK